MASKGLWWSEALEGRGFGGAGLWWRGALVGAGQLSGLEALSGFWFTVKLARKIGVEIRSRHLYLAVWDLAGIQEDFHASENVVHGPQLLLKRKGSHN